MSNSYSRAIKIQAEITDALKHRSDLYPDIDENHVYYSVWLRGRLEYIQLLTRQLIESMEQESDS